MCGGVCQKRNSLGTHRVSWQPAAVDGAPISVAGAGVFHWLSCDAMPRSGPPSWRQAQTPSAPNDAPCQRSMQSWACTPIAPRGHRMLSLQCF